MILGNKVKRFSYFNKLVSFSFWLIYFVDRKLIYPVILDSIVPDWQNHVMHTLPLASLLLESFLTKHKYPSFLKGLKSKRLIFKSLFIFKHNSFKKRWICMWNIYDILYYMVNSVFWFQTLRNTKPLIEYFLRYFPNTGTWNHIPVLDNSSQ